jgi:hypothetical protein
MPKKQDTEILVILDCCKSRFSKVLPINGRPPVAGGDIFITCGGKEYSAKITQIFPKKGSTNPYVLDAVFVESGKEVFLNELRKALDVKDGWHEGNGARKRIKRVR